MFFVRNSGAKLIADLAAWAGPRGMTGSGHAAKSARARAKSDLPSTAAVRRRNCIIASRQFVTFLGAASRNSEPASKESL